MFFREVRPGSEMASQNDQNKAKWERKLSKPRRTVTIRNWDGAMRATPRTPRNCDGPRGSLSMRYWGWLANVRSRRGPRACFARIDRQ